MSLFKWRLLEEAASGREGGLNRRVALLLLPARIQPTLLPSPSPLSYSASRRTPIQGGGKNATKNIFFRTVSIEPKAEVFQGRTGRTEHHKHECLKSSRFFVESILRLPSPSAAGGWVSEPHLNRRRWFTLPPRSPTLIPHPRAPLPVIKDKTCASLHSPFQIQPLHFIELLSTQQAQIQSIVQFSHHQQRRVDFNNPFLFTGFPDQLSGFHSLEKD